jgi:hypothetical protein
MKTAEKTIESPMVFIFDDGTAWAVQLTCGDTIDHTLTCASRSWLLTIGAKEELCDCGALQAEWNRQKKDGRK